MNVFTLIQTLRLWSPFKNKDVLNNPEYDFFDTLKTALVDKLKKQNTEGVVAKEDFVEFREYCRELATILHNLGLCWSIVVLGYLSKVHELLGNEAANHLVVL